MGDGALCRRVVAVEEGRGSQGQLQPRWAEGQLAEHLAQALHQGLGRKLGRLATQDLDKGLGLPRLGRQQIVPKFLVQGGRHCRHAQVGGAAAAGLRPEVAGAQELGRPAPQGHQGRQVAQSLERALAER